MGSVETPVPGAGCSLLGITVRRDGPTGCIVLTGEFDMSSRDAFAEAVGRRVEDDPVACLVVDAGHLAFIDSSGLTALLAARASSLAVGVDVQLGAVSSTVRRVIAVGGVANELLPGDPPQPSRRRWRCGGMSRWSLNETRNDE